MLFKISHSVAANTTAQDPDWQKLQVARGQIKRWLIILPVEASNLLQLQIRYHGHQILPINEDEWYYAGGFMFDPEDWIELDEADYELDVYAKNADTVESHEYNIYCNIKPSKPKTPEEISEGVREALQDLLGE